MIIDLRSFKQVEYMEPLSWFDDNKFNNSALLTGDSEKSDFSISAWNPVYQYSYSQDKTVWDQLAILINRYDFSNLPYPANRCGWIGYLSYDLGGYLEEIPNLTTYSYRIPEARLTLFKNYRYWDNKRKIAWQIEFDFTNFIKSEKDESEQDYQISNFSQECNEEEYCDKVKEIQNMILSGDVYEVNLTQEFTADFSGSSWAFFRKLYQKNQGPFSAFLNYSEFSIASISPEEFLKYDKGMVETKPIKGTAARGKNDEEDKQNKDMLLNSAKDLAELHMIVDLLRNDLSKVCEIGSVNVINPNKLETFSNVFHLVGLVEGRLKSDLSIVDLIKACYPGGSITGCPKIASMKVIEELESFKRNIYTGSVFLANNNFLSSSIVIRTGIIIDGKLLVNSGGAVTIESDPASEYQEILHKIRNFLDIKEKK